ncbi:Alkaline phosphatase [anaerobic digester metagenome]
MKKKYFQFVFALAITWLFINPAVFAQYEKTEESGDKLTYVKQQPYETVKATTPAGKVVKNVILMIGDGMGLTQVSTAWVANHGNLNIDNFPVIGLKRTYAANKLITDSGAAGTALATGEKTNYHSVGVDTAGNSIPSLTDLASEKGLSTAVVVTCNLSDATPSAFCASNKDRDNEEEIAADYLNCNVDYIFGGGRNQFYKRKDGRNLFKEMEAKGYQVSFTWEETAKIETGKVFSVLDDGQLPLYPERGEVFKDATLHALSLLAGNEKGFFAMFEGSRIDDCGHWHDIPALINEMADFDQTIGRVLQWAEKDGETLVIVLADHETGGLTLLGGDISKGEVKGHYSTGSHSGIHVPVYAWGPGAEEFAGIYENTDIFNKIAGLLKLK